MSAALIVTTVIAVLGFVTAYLNSLRLALRRDRLEWTSRQLGELYGPLLSLLSASKENHDVLFQSLDPDGLRRPSDAFGWQPTFVSEDDAVTWRLWVMEVFMPTNRRIVEVITSKADLLEEAAMPKSLLKVCAHVASYEPVLKRWEAGDFRYHVALIAFPSEALGEVEKTFQLIKAHQAALLGHGTPWWRRMLGRRRSHAQVRPTKPGEVLD